MPFNTLLATICFLIVGFALMVAYFRDYWIERSKEDWIGSDLNLLFASMCFVWVFALMCQFFPFSFYGWLQ